MSTRAPKSKFSRRVIRSAPAPLALEPRFQYDGAAVASAAHAHAHARDVWREGEHGEHDGSAQWMAGWRAAFAGNDTPANV
ncbi:MAG TPA: hypothetical protein VGG24_01415, partial [Paraburkholderia sp.]